MKNAVIIPTGDEIRNGIVLDTDSPAIMALIVRFYPEVSVLRTAPVSDAEESIQRLVESFDPDAPDLIVLIGGSGGGHRHSDTLGKDYTHSALEAILSPVCSSEIYGKNGHLWTRLLCGKRGACLVVNVPGPYVEACAATQALLEALSKGRSIYEINQDMSDAVFAQFPVGSAQKEY